MGTQDSAPGLSEEMAGRWGQLGDLMVHTQAHNDARFDRLDADVAELKLDMARLVTDSVETREQLNRMELSHARFADRVEARFEQLIALMRRDETGG